MDPQATLRLASEAIDEGNISAAFQHLMDYSVWTARSGFETDALAAEFDKVQAKLETACDKLAEFHFADLHE